MNGVVLGTLKELNKTMTIRNTWFLLTLKSQCGHNHKRQQEVWFREICSTYYQIEINLFSQVMRDFSNL